MNTNFNEQMVYRDLVFAALLKHHKENGEEKYELERKVKKENQSKFIEAVKEGIDVGIPQANKKVVEFNTDYTSVFIRPCFLPFSFSQWLKKVKQDIKRE